MKMEQLEENGLFSSLLGLCQTLKMLLPQQEGNYLSGYKAKVCEATMHYN